jgi:hypothetical protein
VERRNLPRRLHGGPLLLQHVENINGAVHVTPHEYFFSDDRGISFCGEDQGEHVHVWGELEEGKNPCGFWSKKNKFKFKLNFKLNFFYKFSSSAEAVPKEKSSSKGKNLKHFHKCVSRVNVGKVKILKI